MRPAVSLSQSVLTTWPPAAARANSSARNSRQPNSARQLSHSLVHAAAAKSCRRSGASASEARLLDKQDFPKLVAADEGFAAPKSAEQVLNLAVLIGPLDAKQSRRGDKFESLAIQNPIAVKGIRFAGMEHRENHAAGAKHIGKMLHEPLDQRALHAIEEIPQEDGVEIVAWGFDIRLEKAVRAGIRGHFRSIFAGLNFPQALVLGGHEMLPIATAVGRRDLKAPRDEECDRRFPHPP